MGNVKVPFGKVIRLADTLSPSEQHRVLRHELAHHVLGEHAAESTCDLFSRLFAQVHDDEVRGAQWRVQQERQLANARAAARCR
jgi:hypothetical protein